jgi:hypothetical protein
VNARPNLDPQWPNGLECGFGASDSAGRAVEDEKEAIADGVYFGTPKALNKLAGAPVVIGDQLLPRSIALRCRHPGAVDNVREQYGYQHPVQIGRGQSTLDPAPCQPDEWIVSNDPRVMARWNVDDVHWSGLELSSIAKVNPHPAAEHHA